MYVCFATDKEAKKFKHGPGEGQGIGFFTLSEALKLKLPKILRLSLSQNEEVIKEAMKNKTVPHGIIGLKKYIDGELLSLFGFSFRSFFRSFFNN